MKEILKTLNSFNSKADRLERSGFSQRFNDKLPEVKAEFKKVSIENAGNGEFYLTGELNSWTMDYQEDEVDAVVLTYRILTQNNDRLSLRNLSSIYNSPWMPDEGKEFFNEARGEVNEFLDSSCTIAIGNKIMSKRDLMDIVIYGGLAHSNTKKESIFNSWINSNFSGFIQTEFMASLNYMIHSFYYFRDLNKSTLKFIEINNLAK